MRSEIKRGYVAATTITIAIAMLALNMVGPIISSTTDFSIFNTGWNGTSNFAIAAYETGKLSPSFEVRSTGSDLTVVKLELDQLELDPMDSSLFVIGPDIEFTESEGVRVGNFVRSGGVLLLADDFGTSNTLLQFMGAGSRFSNKLVMDLAFDKKPEFSICFDFENDPIADNVTTILLNYPSSLIPGSANSEVIAWTSVASWQDLNGDHDFSYGEPWGPFPLIAKERLGQGVIILLADPSLLINGMRDHLDNAIISDNLMNEISAFRTEVFFDESHHQYFDPVTITAVITGSFSDAQKIFITLLALALLVWLSTDFVDRGVFWIWRKSKSLVKQFISILFGKKIEKPEIIAPDIEELAKKLIEEHPEWKIGMVRYAIREKMRHSKFIAKAAEEE